MVMAAPAQSGQSGSDVPRITASMQFNITHAALKDLCDNIERFKASLHGAAIGAHTWSTLLPDAGGATCTELKFVVHRLKKALRRTPKVGPIARCPPPSENVKMQAQQALLSRGVKRAFEDAFPGDALDTALDALCDMILSQRRFGSDKAGGIRFKTKQRFVKLLRKRPAVAAVDCALNALWACLPYTQFPLKLDLPDFEKRRKYFASLHEALSSTPPRLEGIPEFCALQARVRAKTGEDAAPSPPAE